MGGGSGSGGGSSTTVNQMMPWSQYVPREAYGAYKNLLPILQSRMDTGLLPKEFHYYRNQGLKDLGSSYAGVKRDLGENLARSGVRGGAVSEAYGDLARDRIFGQSKLSSDLAGMDIQQKNYNIERLMKAIGIPGAPVVSGSTTTVSPSRGGGGS